MRKKHVVEDRSEATDTLEEIEESTLEDSFCKTRNRYSRSSSPLRPPRPRQTIINNALSPSRSPRLSSPAISPTNVHFSPGEDSLRQEGLSPPVHTNGTHNSSESTSSKSPTSTHSTSPPAQDPKPSPDTLLILVDALLKIILQSGNTEVKACLTDLLVTHPFLAERFKRAKES